MFEYLKSLSSKKYYCLIVVFAFIVLSAMRIAFINADGPQDISISAATYTDEGFKTYASRNMALYGDWRWSDEDEYAHWLERGPLPNYTFLWIFKTFGVSFASIRSVSIIYSVFSLLLLFVFLKRNYDDLTAALGLLLAGTNFYFTMYNRLGLYESHLIFYVILAMFCFAEVFMPWKKTPRLKGYGVFPGILSRTIFLAGGLAALIACYNIKKSFLVIFLSVIPALIIYACGKSVILKKYANAVLISILSGITTMYLLFAHVTIFKMYMAKFLFEFTVFGKPVIEFIPFWMFDPLHIMLGKNLYNEFIFLHPVTFFLAAFFSIYILHEFITRSEGRLIDLIMASWLVFGFIFLSLMYYHPSRYYLLVFPPMMIIASRAVSTLEDGKLQSFLFGKKNPPYNILAAFLWITAFLYSAVVIYVMVIPAWTRNSLIKKIYPYFETGGISGALPVLAPMVLTVAAVLVVIFLSRKRVFSFIKRPDFNKMVLIIIVVIQMFQYGKWFIFHDNNLFEASKNIGSTLPSNSIIAGSWSSGLTIENRLKPLIVQWQGEYNHRLVGKLIRNEPVSINTHSGGSHGKIMEKNIPLYIAVCRNVVFERKITERYRDLFIMDNLVRTFHFGYFDVELYKIR
ncbi:MAG: hypothetical protein MUD12_03370 [Spirochaetes bacterium]|jgi:4-amino-4-deoxy-L-arabinose transferase-like glycosyltransferase|nr:hypothetical protein [Spirochaetota bacterium]